MKIFFLTLLALIFTDKTHALELSNFSLPISGSVGIGKMENSDLNLKARTMNAFSIEALPSFNYDNWQFGVHLDYRWQGQVTSLKEAGGTNLKGHGYLMGLGVRHNFSEKFFIQGSADFLGEYDFSKHTANNDDDKVTSPLGVRLKSGYAIFAKIPNLTVDLDLQYLTFKKIHIASEDSSATTTQLMASVGMTYVFEKIQ